MDRKVPTRMCVGCREMKEKKELFRVIRTAGGELMIDETGRMNGRGAYICRSLECLELACRNHGLERSLRTGIPKNTAEGLFKEMKDKLAE